MPTIINTNNISFEQNKSAMPQFTWHTSVPRISEMVNSKHLIMDVRSLDPGKYSFPYHFHRFAEELFVIFSGSATLRTPEGLKTVGMGEMVFFEIGESSAHQLYNHTQEPCTYLDIRTTLGFDVTEYPDSDKINVFPGHGIFQKSSKVEYLHGEDNIDEIWDKLK